AIETSDGVGMLAWPAGSSTVERGAHNSQGLGSTPSRPTRGNPRRGRGVGGATRRLDPVRRIAIVCLTCAVTLGAPATAPAGGLFPGTDPAGGSLVSPGGGVRYDVRPGTDATTVTASRLSDGHVVWKRSLTGVYGTALTTTRGGRGGLSADGS